MGKHNESAIVAAVEFISKLLYRDNSSFSEQGRTQCANNDSDIYYGLAFDPFCLLDALRRPCTMAKIERECATVERMAFRIVFPALMFSGKQ